MRKQSNRQSTGKDADSSKIRGNLSNAALVKLQSSGLEKEDSKRLRLQVYTGEQLKSKYTDLPVYVGGIHIPYFDLEGKPTKFWRFRYLEDTRTGFLAETNRKPLRYVQPKKSNSEIYLPPLLPPNFGSWKKVATAIDTPIMITEGEFKSASSCKLFGMPTIGLGGVWSFKSTAELAPLLPQFEQIAWKGRIVYICYDSDAATNPQVVMAENALARELTRLGAEPYIVRIPMNGSGKVGVDDYLMKHGTKQFSALVQHATAFKSAQELFRLNSEVIYIRDPGYIMEFATRQRVSPRAFVDHLYSTRRYYEEQVSKTGTKLVEKSAAKEWIQWPQRCEIQRSTYAPGQPTIVGNAFNVWNGWGVQPRGDKELIKLWHQLLDYLFKGAPDERDWFEKWLAYPLQNPGTKMYSAAVLWGRHHGTGKSLIGYTMFKIYGDNATEIEDQDLQNTANDWADNKQFIMGDEITGGEKFAIADRMRSLITRKELRVNIKYVPRFTVPDVINYYFTSNHPDSFFLEDDDRRYFVHEVTGVPMDEEFYIRYDEALNKDKDNRFAAAVFQHLLTLPLTGFNPKGHAMKTAARAEMIEYGKTDVGRWVTQLQTNPDSVLKNGQVVIPYSVYKSEDLLALYDPEQRKRASVNAMSRELRKAGFARFSGVVTATGQFNLWLVRPTDKLKPRYIAADIGRLYDDERASASKIANRSKVASP